MVSHTKKKVKMSLLLIAMLTLTNAAPANSAATPCCLPRWWGATIKDAVTNHTIQYVQDKYLPRKHWDTYDEHGLVKKEMVFFYDKDSQGRSLIKTYSKIDGCHEGRYDGFFVDTCYDDSNTQQWKGYDPATDNPLVSWKHVGGDATKDVWKLTYKTGLQVKWTLSRAGCVPLRAVHHRPDGSHADLTYSRYHTDVNLRLFGECGVGFPVLG